MRRWLRFVVDPANEVARLLWAVLIVALLAWAFVAVASEVMEGETTAFDHYLASLFRSASAPRALRGPPWLQNAMINLSALGSTPVLVLVTVLAAGLLALRGSGRVALMMIGSCAAGAVVMTQLKQLIGRARPDALPDSIVVHGLSFPSGHASMSALVYLTLGALLASTRGDHAERLYVVGVAVVLAGLVGLTRVYLGAHWATDVIAGWTFGAAWALAWLAASRFVRWKFGDAGSTR